MLNKEYPPEVQDSLLRGNSTTAFDDLHYIFIILIMRTLHTQSQTN